MEIKRRDNSNSKQIKGPFRLSVKYIGKDISKTDQTQILATYKQYDKQVKVTPDTDLDNLFKEYITSIGIFKKGSPTKSDENVENVDFIFLDFDSGITIGEVQTILEKHQLRYIIVPSHSHTEEHHKFHLYVPVYKRITDIQDYKIYFHHLSNLFKEKNDSAAKNPSRASFATKSSAKIISTFNSITLGDLFIDTKLRNSIKKTLEYESKHTNKIDGYTEDIHENFLKHILNLRPEMKFHSHDQKNGITKFYRSEQDDIANLFLNEADNPKRIADPSIGQGKDHMELLFSNQDFFDAQMPEEIREDTVKEIESMINWTLRAEDLLIIDNLISPGNFSERN